MEGLATLFGSVYGERTERQALLYVSQDELKKKDTAGVQWILLSEGRKEGRG